MTVIHCVGAVYFRLWNESIKATNVPKDIISVNVWYTSMASPPFGGNADRPEGLLLQI
jgi:hypothetical protein